MSYGQLIQTVTVGAGGAASIDFTSIPGTYTDLLLVYSVRSNYASGTLITYARLNGDTASNYSYRYLMGDGSAASSTAVSSDTLVHVGYVPNSGVTANTFANGSVLITSYAASSAKLLSAEGVSENNGSAAQAALIVGRWGGTAAVTSISLIAASGNMVQYSTASLYGIK